jgi:DNA polymerase V
MQCLARFTNDLEVYSIDEAFLGLDDMNNYREYGLSIKQACWKEQRMPVSVGIAATKTLAKLANHIAKKSTKLQGVCVIEETQQWQAVFSRLPVKTVWGIGRGLAKQLEQISINSVEDLRQANIKLLRKQFGVVVERTVRELNGEPCLELTTQAAAKKQIISSRSFGKKITALHSLQEAVASHTAKAACKLRQQQSLCQQISVTLETSRFTTEQPRHSRVQILPYPTHDTRLLISTANTLCKQLYQQATLYSKAGICLTDISESTQQQSDLFASTQNAKADDLMQALDKLNQRFGKGQVFLARQGIKHEWQMQQAFKSPCYTTRLNELPIIKL